MHYISTSKAKILFYIVKKYYFFRKIYLFFYTKHIDSWQEKSLQDILQGFTSNNIKINAWRTETPYELSSSRTCDAPSHEDHELRNQPSSKQDAAHHPEPSVHG